MTENIAFTPIGVVHSPFCDRTDVPKGPYARKKEIVGTVEIDPAYHGGLADLDGFSHIIIVAYLHQGRRDSLTAHPPWDTQPRGVFSTRSPDRPNPIALTTVRLERIEGGVLHVRGLDLIEGTAVLDIKPWLPLIEETGSVRLGWLTERIASLEQDFTHPVR